VPQLAGATKNRIRHPEIQRLFSGQSAAASTNEALPALFRLAARAVPGVWQGQVLLS